MGRKESIAWLEQEARDIASTTEVQERLMKMGYNGNYKRGYYSYDWYFHSFMPVCAKNYKYAPGDDILVSVNAEYGDFSLIKAGMIACIWIWVSADKKLVDSAGMYFGGDGEVYVSTSSGEIAIECVKQISGCLKAFCVNWFCFYSPFKDRYHSATLSDNKIEQREESTNGSVYRSFCKAKSWRDVWENLWLKENNIHLLCRDRISIEVPQKEEVDINIRDWKKDVIHIQDEWFESFLKERERKFEETKEKIKEDIYSLEKAKKYWGAGGSTNAIIGLILFGVILWTLCLLGDQLPVLVFLFSFLLSVFLFFWGRKYLPFAFDPSLKQDVLRWKNVIQKAEPKPFPEELKELAWLYHVKGYRISQSPPQLKNDLRIPIPKQYYGYMEELSTKYPGIDKDTTISLTRGYIPANVAAQLGMGKNMSWKECYDLITGKDLILK